MTAVATGGSSGIGRGIVRSMASEWANVVVADVRVTPREGGESTGTRIEAETDADGEYVECDVATPLGSDGGRVNTIHPGLTEAAMVTGEVPLVGSRWEEQLVEATPLGHLADLSEIGDVASFLASDLTPVRHRRRTPGRRRPNDYRVRGGPTSDTNRARSGFLSRFR